MTSESTEGEAGRTTHRRVFLKRCAKGVVGLGLAGLGYAWFEAGWVRVRRVAVNVPRLPGPLRGTTIALLADIHHGPFTGLDYVKHVVGLANGLAPDVILLGGDYVHRDRQYIGPCFEALAKLKSPGGVYGVLGNHDHWEGARETREAMAKAGVHELTNSGVWLERDGARLRLAGVGDLWEDQQDLDAALADARETDAAILLSHNPDYVETLTDPRVGLVLSGHTHGGQVVLPVVGAPLVPSRYGQKYLRGLVQTPRTQVYITRGLGTVTPPLRFACRPEIALLTLASFDGERTVADAANNG